MADVKLRGIDKYFGSLKVVDGIDLDIAHGEFVVFVGPSGCGKSTLLRMIAGLEDISYGELYIDDMLCNDVAPRDRGIAMVFQSYALYPHMTVYENVGFALRFGDLPMAERDAKIREAARTLQMEELLDRKPAQLSGGQRQRVAIGRAIVRHPKVFLFDEPLSNLDAALRVDMRMEIARLHQDIGATMIYVTHDQVEAMTLADKIVVLDKGIVQQAGAPLDLYRKPQNLFVAGFIGSPKMNLLPVERVGGKGSWIEVGSSDMRNISLDIDSKSGPLPHDLKLGIRPQAIRLTDPEKSLMPAKARLIEHLGDETVVSAELANGNTALIVLPGDAILKPGEQIGLTFDPTDAHLFMSSGQRIQTGRAV
jgi:multiple sugar transport system ATP-binding protein